MPLDAYTCSQGANLKESPEIVKKVYQSIPAFIAPLPRLTAFEVHGGLFCIQDELGLRLRPFCSTFAAQHPTIKRRSM